MARVVSRFSVRYTVGSRSSSSISTSTTVVRCWLGQMNSTRWGPLASKSPELVLVTGAPHCGHLICGSSCGGDSLMRVIRCVAVRGLVCCAFPDSRIRETRLGDSWLKQFHRIAGGILDDDLFATDTDHDGVAHRDARRSKPVHGAGEILNLHGKSIPASGALWSAVGHWLSTAAARIRHTQNEPQIAERQHGERRGRMQIEVEAKVRHIECNGCLDVIHNVTDLNGRHGS